MPDELPVLKVPEQPKKDFHPERMRRFVRHLSAATISAEERAHKKNTVKNQLEKVKGLALNKRSTKEQIEHEFGSFESTVHDIIKDEEKILEEQRRETKQISELKEMVENLSRKLIGVGRDYAKELEDKDAKIMELREALAAAHIKISESGEDRQKKIEDIERRVKQKQDLPPPPMTRDDHIAQLEDHLGTLEQRHKELQKTGQHSKKDLDRVKKLITKHKDTIGKLKAKKK
ncbi:hypothetical protein KY363_03410 [Candidatus Woesearchaeota archaeon]|nr:hypothetical protein [Candidatus Woesearchaeota archaeon]